MKPIRTGKLVVAVSGASGAIYAQRFLRQAVSVFEDVYLILSRQAVQVATTELGCEAFDRPFTPEKWLGVAASNLKLLDSSDYFTPPASGSFRHDGMVVIPCSMGTLGRIANGISDDLLTRSADVCLKERRPLVVVPREMPYNLIMLRNMTQLAEAGAVVIPASPAWYGKPTSLEELADTVVARVLQTLGVEQQIVRQWMIE